uniref:Uncharacterized protein n=1 Tax=Arundo donax TaxID=35708 RepID=A0A0A8Z0N1_ARUDO
MQHIHRQEPPAQVETLIPKSHGRNRRIRPRKTTIPTSGP